MKKVYLLLLVLFATNLYSQNQVNRNLFGFRTNTLFIFFDSEDSLFLNEIKSLTPNVLSFPGGFGNFYHLNGIGYGLRLEEIKKFHKKSKIKTVYNLNKIIHKKKHDQNYIYDFIKIAKATGSNVIYDANIITSHPNEILEVIKLFLDNNIKLLGVELGGELSNRSYAHFMNIDKYISLSKKYAKIIRTSYNELSIAVVAAPNDRGLSKMQEWNSKLSQEDFYDAIIIHPYAKVVKGRDVAGKMLEVISEGVSIEQTFQIYKRRALQYVTRDFKEKITNYNKTFNNKKIWMTEWNLQMSNVTGNTLLQALFVSHQLIELASLQLSNIDIATFHNLAGRTVSGDMIMIDQQGIRKNATFNSMKIINELFKDSLFFAYKKEIKKECFEYCFTSKTGDRKLYYWINWSERMLKKSRKYTGRKSVFFSDNLFDKNLKNQEIRFFNNDHFDSELILEPYSVTFFDEIIKK